MEEQYCTFFVRDLFLGIKVLSVQEILRYQPMTAVPLASEVISGLINLRGEIVTAIDLRRRLGLADRTADCASPTNIIVRTASGPVSFLVDAIDDVISVDVNAFEPPPPALVGPLRTLTHGVYKLESRLLLILEHEQIADVADIREPIDSTAMPPALAGATAGA